MSGEQTQAVENTLTDDDVLNYLKTNPEFLIKHPKILEKLKAPGQSLEDGIVDFQQVMVERLKEDKTKAVQLSRDLVETSQKNMDNQNRIHSSILAILEARSFIEFIEIIFEDVTSLVGVDICGLAIEENWLDVAHLKKTDGLQILDSGQIKTWFGDGDAILHGNIRGREEIYGKGAPLIKSEGLLKLEFDPQTPIGLIAFGSRDPELFHPEQAIDQVCFLAQVIERAVQRWLVIPKEKI